MVSFHGILLDFGIESDLHHEDQTLELIMFWAVISFGQRMHPSVRICQSLTGSIETKSTESSAITPKENKSIS